ncbi:hypothetical protein ES703_110130 [subsurface metagenome]
MKPIIATIVAIVAIAGLEAYAISQGINGVALAGSCSLIAGLGGYQINKIVKKKPPDDSPPD